jgi:sugar/nucleoside kinase (ribokinase family)
MGGRVRLVAAAGQDALGTLLESWLSSRVVDCSALHRDSTTPALISLASPEAEHVTVVYPGSTASLNPAAVEEVLPPRGGTLLLAGLGLLPGFCGEAGAALLSRARAAGVHTALALMPVPGGRLTMAALDPLLPATDLVFSTADVVRRTTRRGEAEAGAHALLDAGAAGVAVMRGTLGSSVYRPSPVGIQRTEAMARWHGEPAPGARGAMSTAAAYAAAFLFALARNDNDFRAATLANSVAARVAGSAVGVLAL